MSAPITTIIVDDQSGCIETLSQDLGRFQDIRIVETATSAEKARKIIIKQQPDLLFLDVEMPKQTGIDLLNEIRPSIHSKLYVVFYSAFDKYMIDALRASAFDYLLKPYQPEELTAIIERVRQDIKMGTVNFEQSMRRLLADDRKFAMQTVTGLLLLRREDILYFQYANEARAWQMVLTDHSMQRLRLSIKGQEILNISTSFIQISQDIILNADYLMSIENGSLHCVLCPPHSDIDIKASKRYYSKIKETLEIV